MIDIRYKRPANIKAYKKQCEFIDAPERFTIVEATTKAGKTVGCIIWLFEMALNGKDGDNYWWVAPTYTIAKIAYRRMKRFIKPKSIYVENKSELTLTLISGATIFFKGADNPDSLYGEDVMGAVLDEASRMKDDAWFAVFTTLTATKGKCKIIGNVKGVDNWNYHLAREAEAGKKEDWAYFKITAADAVEAGILEQSVIDEARRTLPNGIFLELYYGIPFVNSSNRFCFSFDELKHVRQCEYNPKEIVYLSFDFNVNPMSVDIIQWDGYKKINVIEIVQLENSNVFRMAEVIATKFPNRNTLFRITGDASGKNRSTLNPDNMNNFQAIQTKLNDMGYKVGRNNMDILKSNARLEDSQTLVNAILEHCDVSIDPDKAAKLIFDMKFAEVDSLGKLKKSDRNQEAQRLEALDGFRYFCQQYLQKRIKLMYAA